MTRRWAGARGRMSRKARTWGVERTMWEVPGVEWGGGEGVGGEVAAMAQKAQSVVVGMLGWGVKGWAAGVGLVGVE